MSTVVFHPVEQFVAVACGECYRSIGGSVVQLDFLCCCVVCVAAREHHVADIANAFVRLNGSEHPFLSG